MLVFEDHVSCKDDISSKGQETVAMATGGTFAGVGDFSAVPVTTTVAQDDYSSLVKDNTACIR